MYEKPVVLNSEEMAEGVFTASGNSGGDCYTTTAYIHQTPEVGRDSFVVQVNARHDADHNSDHNQLLHITFNKPVNYISSNGNLEGGNGTNTLLIGYGYWNNHQDNIGLGDVYVMTVDGSREGLTVDNVWLEDRAKQY